MKLTYLAGALWLSLLPLTGCLHSYESGVDLNETPADDSKYLKHLTRDSRDMKIIENFEMRYTITVTYLSPEFRAAFSDRYKSLFNEGTPFLEEANSKAGFFVTMFSPMRQGYDLTDDQLWSIQLKNKEGNLKPTLVKRLYTKERWQPFFKDVSYWSQEYLVLFDTPSVSTSEKLMNKNTLTLNIANADAKVSMDW